MSRRHLLLLTPLWICLRQCRELRGPLPLHTIHPTSQSVNTSQVVFASREIINANSTSHPGLTKALRGGSNNCGIVTAFDLRIFPQGRYWGGFVGKNISTRYAWFDAFASFTGDPNYSPYAALINSYVWSKFSHQSVYCLKFHGFGFRCYRQWKPLNQHHLYG
jgi:hypothetical protein